MKIKSMSLSLGLTLSSITGFFFSENLLAYSTLTTETVGTYALAFRKRANVWSRLEFVAVDGEVKTSPPDSIKYDRKIEAMFLGGLDSFVAPNIAIRGNLKANWLVRKEEEKDPPKSPIERSYSIIEPSVDLTYINPKGLELFAGVALHSVSEYEEKQTSASVSSTTKLNAVQLFVPHFGVMRRTPAWNGGLYFVKGREEKRSFAKTASDGSTSSGEEAVYIPTEIGMVAEMRLSPIFVFEGDVALIQASSGGLKSADGISVKDDFLRFRTSSFFDLGGHGVNFKLGYDTLSYSSNAFMSTDTIPLISSQLLYVQGNKETNVYYGITYSRGSDGQSIPEFNADYKVNAVGITSGLFLAL